MNASGGLAAGWLLVLTTLVFAGLGVLGGMLIDLKFLGGLAGGVLGTFIGFVLIWRVYIVPANEEARTKDYSGLRKFDDDEDEDSW